MRRARGRSRLLLHASVTALALAGGRAYAFDYQEHYAITRAALDGSAEPALPGFAESLARLAGAGAHLCFPPTSLAARAGRKCFVAADIAALAGDHATSPAQVLGRWLRRRGDEDSPPTTSDDDDDESCGEERRRLGEFLDAANRLEAGTLAAADSARALAAADPAARCLARHDDGHHRIPEIAAAAAPFAAEPNAIKSYYEWHERARAAVALAGAQPEQDWSGIALLSELYAQHFLQDAVAAGRMVTPRQRLDDSIAYANRSHHDRAGVPVLLPDALCASPAEATPARAPALAARCAAHPAEARVFGDHFLRADAQGRAADDVTFDLAVALSVASLHDLFATSAAPELARASCARAIAALPADANIGHWLDSAWQGSACAAAQVGERRSDRGAPAIIALLPSPLAPSPLYTLSGGTMWQLGTEVGTKYVGFGVGVSWLSRPFHGDRQVALGLHLFSAVDVSDSGGGVFAEYLIGNAILGVGMNGRGRSLQAVTAGTGATESAVRLCALPFARVGLDLRLFEHRLATAATLDAGPAFCQDGGLGANVVVGLRLSLKSDERVQR